MRYTLFLHYPERAPEDISEEEMRQGMNSFDKFAKELDHAGVLVSAEMFQRTPDTTTVQLVDETIRVFDGPLDDSLPIGGVFVLEVEEYGDALYWAKHAPSIAWGPVEVRGAMVLFADGAWHQVEQPETREYLYDSDELRAIVEQPEPSTK